MDPEKVAYWYFRLNGFLLLENFVIHPPGKGGQRTDADLLAVRFPHRAERLYDDPGDIMEDDSGRLSLTAETIDIAIVEVKTNQPCTLNGPWTEPDRQNVHRVLAAIGCLPQSQIDAAAGQLYELGVYFPSDGPRVRLIAVGGSRNDELARAMPNVVQVTWSDALGFIWRRLNPTNVRRRRSTSGTRLANL